MVPSPKCTCRTRVLRRYSSSSLNDRSDFQSESRTARLARLAVSRNVTLVQLMLNVYYFFSTAQPPYLPTEIEIATRLNTACGGFCVVGRAIGRKARTISLR